MRIIKFFSISDILLLPSNFLVSKLKIENGFIYLVAEKKQMNYLNLLLEQY